MTAGEPLLCTSQTSWCTNVSGCSSLTRAFGGSCLLLGSRQADAAVGSCVCVAVQQKPVSTYTELSMPVDAWKSLTPYKDTLREQ